MASALARDGEHSICRSAIPGDMSVANRANLQIETCANSLRNSHLGE